MTLAVAGERSQHPAVAHGEEPAKGWPSAIKEKRLRFSPDLADGLLRTVACGIFSRDIDDPRRRWQRDDDYYDAWVA